MASTVGSGLINAVKSLPLQNSPFEGPLIG